MNNFNTMYIVLDSARQQNSRQYPSYYSVEDINDVLEAGVHGHVKTVFPHDTQWTNLDWYVS